MEIGLYTRGSCTLTSCVSEEYSPVQSTDYDIHNNLESQRCRLKRNANPVQLSASIASLGLSVSCAKLKTIFEPKRLH